MENPVVSYDDDSIVCYDDSIVFRGQKHEVGLHPEWKKLFNKAAKINYYFHPETKKRYSLDKAEEAIKAGAVPVSDRRRKFSKDSYIFAKDSYIEFRFNDLYEDIGSSRYRKGLDELVNQSCHRVFTYRSDSEKRSRNHIEAMRQRLKRHWKVSSYEHNSIIFDEALGKALLKNLFPYNQDKTRSPGETIYIKGFNSSESILVKVYDVSKKEVYNRSVVKIEVTLRKDWLKTNGMREIKEFTLQPVIQKKIETTLKREWRNVFKKAGLIKECSKVMGTTQMDLFDEMADQRNTLEEVLYRMDQNDKEVKQLKMNQKKIMEHIGMDKQQQPKD